MLRTKAAATALIACTLSGCTPQASGDLGALQSLAETCPKAQLAEYAGTDVSGSGLQANITAARAIALKSIATKVAACNGHLRVVAFTGSAAASSTIFDGDFKPAGATEIARLRRVTALVDSTMKQIDDGIAEAAKTLSPDGSDITAQFRLAGEYGKQLGATKSITLSVDLLTDGVQTVGVVLNTGKLTAATAADLALHSDVTPLPPTATVKVSGLGKTAGTPPPTSYIDAVKTFYLTYCRRTGAVSCTAVTDYAN